MLTMMLKENMCIRSVLLIVFMQTVSFSSVAAESSTNTIHDGRWLEDIPVRRPRIHGGWNTKEDRHSYAQINLKYRGQGHQCGGSLVAPDMVLTAAHCYRSFNKIEIGKYEKDDITDISEEFLSEFEIVHPGYDEDTTRFDVMLVKLRGTSTLATPVRVNRDENVPSNGSMLTVIGMGYNGDWLLPSVFQETSVQYQINDQCGDIVDEKGTTLKGDLYPDMLCAGYDGRDSCYGDSGSPLILKGDNEQEDIQIGVVSWGYECAGILPGVYSRVGYPPVYNFIEQYTCLYSNEPPDYMDCDKWSAAPTRRPSKRPTGTPTYHPTYIPTSMPSMDPTHTMPPTSTESASPTTVRLKEALGENIFLDESDLRLKTSVNIEEVTTPTTPTTPEISSASFAFSTTRYGIATITLFSVFWACILF